MSSSCVAALARRLVVVCPILVSCLSAGAGRALAQPVVADAAAVSAAVARPLSPGAVALLVDHARHPEVQKRLVEALSDERVPVRAVAARVAFMTMSRGLLPTLIRALAKEADADTAAEEVRAVMALVGQPGDELVLRTVQRLGAPSAHAFAEVLARMRPADLPKHLPALLDKGGVNALAEILALACAQHPSSADAIANAVLTSGNAWLWEEFLGAMRESGRALPSAVLIETMKSSHTRTRTVAVWHVALLAAEDPVPDEVLAAALPPASGPPSPLTWEAFGREILARAQGRDATTADWAGLMTNEHRSDARRLPLEGYALLTKPELQALGVVREDRHAGTPRRARRASAGRARRSPDADAAGVRRRSVRGPDGGHRLSAAG